MYLCKQIQSMERLDGAFLFHTNCADIKVCFVTDEIVRVRVAFDRELAEESYILSTTAWEDRLDGLFAAERTRVQPVTPDVTVTDAAGTESRYEYNSMDRLTKISRHSHGKMRQRASKTTLKCVSQLPQTHKPRPGGLSFAATGGQAHQSQQS